ncbi:MULTISPECIES: hypothetical protein [unclassified Streptomyces]|uniref:hypothetical protein n=1 Tax=unclassified Streptomyces TaxID=2593676 RepID=UPI002F919B81|nr:hypothetical protein OG832_44005 [Streptomyces sp. NBC_00826]WTB60713.1 hypothetical protein OG832_47900 [Streptomyces sp. NBC_00826]
MNQHDEDTKTGSAFRRRIRKALTERRQAMSGPLGDLGMETLEKMILATVVIGCAVAFVAVFGTKFQELLASFQAAF